jgi:hypothetical protein
MEHVNSGVLLIMTLPGILTLIYGFMVKSSASRYPSLGWGYKSDLTRKNAQVWSEANNFAGKVFIILGIANIILWPLATYTFWDGYETMIYMSCGTFMMLSLVIIMALTEKHLDSMFDRDGNLKAVKA